MSTGRSRTRRPPGVGLVLAVAVLACLTLPPGAPGSSQRPKRAQETYAILAGTVFQEDGRVLPGAQVTVKPDPEGGARSRLKPLTAASDSRGEFAFRVPAAPMRYTVNVKAAGFRTQEKTVSISAEERVDVFFQMERAQTEK